MLGRALLHASASPGLRRAVTGFGPSRALAHRFVAGDGESDALATATRLAAGGLYSTLDLLGEDVHTAEQAGATTRAYVGLLGRIAEVGLAARAEVSLKLSAVGQRLGADGPARSTENAALICAAAAAAGTTLTLDMEDHTTVDHTLGTLRALRADYPWVGAVLQSALLRTPGDCHDLATGGSRVRLVKGAYAEPASVAHRHKSEVDAAYVTCLGVLMAGAGRPLVATHDALMITAAAETALAVGREPESWEYQMLLGIRVTEQARLAAAGHPVRIYVPFGRDWYPYFMRRLAERPANVGFLLRSLIAR